MTTTTQQPSEPFDQRRALCDPTDSFLYRYQGRYNATLNLWDRYKLSQCAGNEACDTQLDENPIAHPTNPIPNVCRLKDGEGCTNDNECLTGSGCIEGFCGGVAGCNATIQAITEDREGNPLDGLDVFIDDNLMGETSLGFLEVNVTGACTRRYNVTVHCNATTICGSDLVQVNINNQTDGIEFDCTICKGETDLHIAEEDVAVYDQSNQKNISVTVHVDSGGASDVKVRFYGIDSGGKPKYAN